MNIKPQNRNSIIALIVSLVALLVTLFAGIINILMNIEAFTPLDPAPYRITLQISAALTILGVAIYAILEPESVRNFLAGRQARYGSNVLITTLAFIGIVVVANYLVETNSKIKEATSWDLTENKANTLSPELTEAMANLPSEMTAIGFYSQVPAETTRSLFEKMETASDGKFSYRFIDPVEDPIAAKEFGVTGDGKIVLQMDGRSEIANYADESEILTAMNRLANPEARTVYFLVGHGENDVNGSGDTAFSRARETLEKKNITVKTLNLLAENRIPEDAKAVIVVGPTKPITANESSLLNNYAIHGGSLVVLENPVPMTDFGEEIDPLAEALDSVWGLRLRNDFVVDTASETIQNAVGAWPDTAHPVTASMNLVTIMPLTRSIEILARTSYTQTALLQTNPGTDSWGETDFTPLQGNAAAISFDPATDVAGPVVLAAASENDQGGKVVVIGSSTFATDGWFDGYGNGDLFVNAVSWAAGQGETYDVTPKDTTQRTYNQPSQIAGLLINLGSVCGIPLIVIGLGVYAWASRRRRG